ncbi:MAG TPA: O-antigen ligase family protein [Terracidiphilus sp.]|nr:O-antigen ligase family protein [Terracidiphilus sp.]
MRKASWGLLLVFVFAIPWEYSLDLGEPLGNVARLAGLALLVVVIPAVLQAGRVRTPGPLQWMVLALYLWFCCSYFWTIDAVATLDKMRAYAQVMMTVWLVWEFAESPADLRWLLRAFVAGSWVLAVLTLMNFGSAEAIAAGQIRFAATGQDPNDVARFLDMGFPLAALLLTSESRWLGRLLAWGCLPVGLLAVLLTASRGGFLAAVVALSGCGVVLLRGHVRMLLVGLLGLPVILAGLSFVVPHETFERLATIPEQLGGGGLNQRIDIWSAGWHAFVQSPLLGTGAGSFVSAAGLSPMDTAHNTVLSILVDGGLCALFLSVAILALAVRSVLQTRGAMLLALGTALVVWAMSSMVATVDENRSTWLLIGLIALAGRLAVDDPLGLAACFPEPARANRFEVAAQQTA